MMDDTHRQTPAPDTNDPGRGQAPESPYYAGTSPPYPYPSAVATSHGTTITTTTPVQQLEWEYPPTEPPAARKPPASPSPVSSFSPTTPPPATTTHSPPLQPQPFQRLPPRRKPSKDDTPTAAAAAAVSASASTANMAPANPYTRLDSNETPFAAPEPAATDASTTRGRPSPLSFQSYGSATYKRSESDTAYSQGAVPNSAGYAYGHAQQSPPPNPYQPASTYYPDPTYQPEATEMRTSPPHTGGLTPPTPPGASAPAYEAIPPETPTPGLNPRHDRVRTYASSMYRPQGWYQKYWSPHYSMYFFLIVGVLFAVGHHLFYRSLHEKEADKQILRFRQGALISFLAKASFATAAVTAFRQRVWLTVRNKVLSVAAVDSLFAATEDLTSLVNVELFKQAWPTLLLAIYVWATPLVVIFASQTLVVQPYTDVINTTCPSVRSFNFAHEGTNNWREPVFIDDLIGLSMSYWNNTDKDPQGEDAFDYWDKASQPLEQVTTMAAFLKMPVTREGAADDICSPGWNCTFTVEFEAPGYKCTELASGVGAAPRKLGGATPPFGTDVLAPTGNLIYAAQAYEGEYANPQIDGGEGGVPISGPPFPEDLGALRTEPVIWVGYTEVDDPSKVQPTERDDPDWDTAFTPKIIGCEHYETAYSVEFSYESSVQKTRVKKRRYLRPVIDTVFERGELADDGTLDNTTATPSENYVRARDDVERYRRVAAYHALGAQFRRFVNGTIGQPLNIAHTNILQTRLTDPHSYHAVRRFPEALQSVYEDMLLSLLSNPQFVSVVWAAEPSKMSGTRKGGDTTKYPCTRSLTSNKYHYRVADLWGVYTAAVALAIAAVGFGTLAVREEGMTRDTRFSDIAAATKGPALEKIPWGPDGMLPGAKKVKVGYGIVVNRGNGGYGFGVEGDVLQGAGPRKSFRLSSSGLP